MVKGISRRVIVVDSPDPRVFEQAIFILRNDAADSGISSRQLVDQAVRIANNYTRSHSAVSRHRIRLTPVLSAALGAATIALAWLLVTLL
ncbi:MAG: hypothetical protein KBS74_07780 [Clostridiales bacterium]|nr:hypothetical protein [Candidatus Cacconaster stercorequi]